MSEAGPKLDATDILRRLDTVEAEQRVNLDDSMATAREIAQLLARQQVIETRAQSISDQLDSKGRDLHRRLDDLSKKDSPWPQVGVIVTIGILALTPIAWLSVENFRGGRDRDRQLIVWSEQLGRISATTEHLSDQVTEGGLSCAAD